MCVCVCVCVLVIGGPKVRVKIWYGSECVWNACIRRRTPSPSPERYPSLLLHSNAIVQFGSYYSNERKAENKNRK